MTEEKTLEI